MNGHKKCKRAEATIQSVQLSFLVILLKEVGLSRGPSLPVFFQCLFRDMWGTKWWDLTSRLNKGIACGGGVTVGPIFLIFEPIARFCCRKLLGHHFLVVSTMLIAGGAPCLGRLGRQLINSLSLLLLVAWFEPLLKPVAGQIHRAINVFTAPKRVGGHPEPIHTMEVSLT